MNENIKIPKTLSLPETLLKFSVNSIVNTASWQSMLSLWQKCWRRDQRHSRILINMCPTVIATNDREQDINLPLVCMIKILCVAAQSVKSLSTKYFTMVNL